MSAVCGSASEMSMPHCPYFLNSNGDASSMFWLLGWWISTPSGWRLAGALGELGLGIEQIHLARSAVLHKLDHGFGLGREMSRARFEIVEDLDAGRTFALSLEQVRQYNGAETKAASLQHLTAGIQFHMAMIVLPGGTQRPGSANDKMFPPDAMATYCRPFIM